MRAVQDVWNVHCAVSVIIGLPYSLQTLPKVEKHRKLTCEQWDMAEGVYVLPL